MASFDPEKFEEKYKHYFPQLQRAYRNAFERMEEEYDSDVVHAIDQRILAESEPFYEGNGSFRVELPDNAADRVDMDLPPGVLGAYRAAIEEELATIFGFDTA